MNAILNRINYGSNKVKYLSIAVIIIQIVASLVVAVYLGCLNVLPARYYVGLIVVLTVLVAAAATLNMFKYWHIAGKVLSVIISVLLVCVCVYAHHTIDMLNAITEEHYDVDSYILVVKYDSDITDVKQLVGKTVGVLDNMNNRNMAEEAFGMFKEALGSDDVTYRSYDSVAMMMTDFNSGVLSALLYNQSVNDMLDEVIEGYTASIRIVAEYEVRAKIEDVMSTEKETAESESESDDMSLEADDIKKPVYNPAYDPNAPGGGGYIGGDSTVDNSKKGPITDRAFNVYISGIDRYGVVSGRSRSDVNIIMTVNPTTKQILLTNTPRDYYVPIPGVTTGNWRDKLTHAGNYGVWTSVRTLENVYDTDIDYYLRVNFTSFIKVIDVLGGVEVDSPKAFKGYHGYEFAAGRITLSTGAQALSFARERYAFSDGDHQRGRNHMAIIEGVINKVMSPAVLTKYPELVSSVASSVQTNMTMDEITMLAKMQIDDMATWTIISQAATGTGGSRECYSMKGYKLSTVLPDQSSVNRCKANISAALKVVKVEKPTQTEAVTETVTEAVSTNNTIADTERE